MRAIGRLLFVCVAGTAACSFLYPLDGLATGHGSPNAGDGSGAQHPAFEAGDSSSAETGAGVDAGTWCMQQVPAPPFCADFDEGDLTTAFLSGQRRSMPSPFVSDPATGIASMGAPGRSPAGAFSAEVAAIGSGSGGSVKVRYQQPLTLEATTVALRFDMRLVSLELGQEVDFASILMPSSAGQAVRAYVSVNATGEGGIGVDDGSTFKSAPFLLPPLDAWHTYAFVASLAPARIQLFVDGSSTVDLDYTASITSSPKASFELGASVYPPSKPVHVVIDNVTFSSR